MEIAKDCVSPRAPETFVSQLHDSTRERLETSGENARATKTVESDVLSCTLLRYLLELIFPELEKIKGLGSETAGQRPARLEAQSCADGGSLGVS